MDEGESKSVALARPARLKPAESLATQKRGEIALLDKRGKMITPARIRRANVLAGVFGAVTLAWAVAVGAWGAIVVGGIVGVLTWHFSRRRIRVLREVTPLLTQYRTAEATERLAALESVSRKGIPRILWLGAAADAAWQRGEHARADQLNLELTAVLAARRGAGARTSKVLVAHSHTMLLWVIGDAARAEALAATLPEPEHGTWAQHRRVTIDLLRAFHFDDPSRLPDDATLLDWAREALAREWIVADLALLAWAFERRSDAETSRWLLAEAPSRMQAPPEVFARMYPKLAAWVAARPGEPDE